MAGQESGGQSVLDQYDANANEFLDPAELMTAAQDLIDGDITDATFDIVLDLYFSNQAAGAAGSRPAICSQYDTDNDGVVSKEEARAGLRDYLVDGTITQQQATDLLECYHSDQVDGYDADDNGTLSDAELFDALADYDAGDITATVLFRVVDRYMSGVAQGATGSRPAACVEYDTDGNGEISRDEVLDAIDLYYEEDLPEEDQPTRQEIIQVIQCHFQDQRDPDPTPTPTPTPAPVTISPPNSPAAASVRVADSSRDCNLCAYGHVKVLWDTGNGANDYRFEQTQDPPSSSTRTWTRLPTSQHTIEGGERLDRYRIVGGLTPGETYYYRVTSVKRALGRTYLSAPMEADSGVRVPELPGEDKLHQRDKTVVYQLGHLPVAGLYFPDPRTTFQTAASDAMSVWNLKAGLLDSRSARTVVRATPTWSSTQYGRGA